MYNLATEEFDKVGTYFYTIVAFKCSIPRQREYNPFYIEPAQEEDDEDDDENDNDADEDIGELVVQPGRTSACPTGGNTNCTHKQAPRGGI
jgi:hypothetical protein